MKKTTAETAAPSRPPETAEGGRGDLHPQREERIVKEECHLNKEVGCFVARSVAELLLRREVDFKFPLSVLWLIVRRRKCTYKLQQGT